MPIPGFTVVEAPVEAVLGKGKGTENQNIMFLYDDQTMSHLKMSNISFYLLLKVSPFSNTYYNDNNSRQFTELQINILQDRKKQPCIKIPTQHYTAGGSLHQTMPIFFTGNQHRCFQNLF